MDKMRKRIPPVLIFLATVTVTLFASVDRELILAVAKNRFKTVVELVEKKKANVNATYDRGKTSLHWAVTGADLKMVAYLIARGAVVDARDEYGDTPLHKAALKKDVDLDIIKYLVLKGANVNAVNRYGWTPLHAFAYYENSLVVKYLIMQEAEITNTTTRKYNEITNGMTALDVAVRRNNSNVIEALQNPDRYRQLSRTPFLVLSVSNEMTPGGDPAGLAAPGRGLLRVTVENRGGASASMVTVVIEPLTNCEGISFGSAESFGLGVGQEREIVVAMEADRSVRDTVAVFRVRAREYAYGRESHPATVMIRTYAPRPPALVLKPEWPADEHPVLKGLEKIRLPFRVGNTNRLGHAEAVALSGFEWTGGDMITVRPVSNIHLLPLSNRTVEMEIEAGADLPDGKVTVAFVAAETNFGISVTNRVVLETRRLLKPALSASPFYRVTVLSNILTNFQTVTVVQTNWQVAEGFFGPESNLTLVTNRFWETNEILRIATNRESGFLLSNTGETAARGVSVAIQSFAPLPPESAGAYEPRSSVYAFTIPEIATNTARVVFYSQFVRTPLTNANRVHFAARDGRGLAAVDTNFMIELY